MFGFYTPPAQTKPETGLVCDRCKHSSRSNRWAGDDLGWLCHSCAYRHSDAVEDATPMRVKERRQYGDLR